MWVVAGRGLGKGTERAARWGRRTALGTGFLFRAGEEDAHTLRGARRGEGKPGAACQSGSLEQRDAGLQGGSVEGERDGEGERGERTLLEPPCAGTSASTRFGSREGD
jgi:hypothetical protein